MKQLLRKKIAWVVRDDCQANLREATLFRQWRASRKFAWQGDFFAGVASRAAKNACVHVFHVERRICVSAFRHGIRGAKSTDGEMHGEFW